MQTSVKSVYWAFIQNGINIYISDSSTISFNAVLLKCAKCNYPWNDQMDECYVCGELKYQVRICPSCRLEFAPEGNVICNVCNKSPILKYLCINQDCPTITNQTPFQTPHQGTRHEGQVTNIKELADFHKEGVFGKTASLSLALMHCTNCGNTSNNYKSIKVFPCLQNGISLSNFVTTNAVRPGDMIFFIQKTNSIRQYDFCIYDGTVTTPTFQYIGVQGISEIIQQVFRTD